MIQEEVNARADDLTIVEQALPSQMLMMMIEEVQKAGFEVRADVMMHLQNAVAAPLSRLDTFSVSRIAKRVDEASRAILHDLSPDDPRRGLYSCATFILLLVDEGRFFDVRNQAVLVSLLLLEDVKDEKKDVDGQEAVWRVEEKQWQQDAKKMLRRANLQGYYLHTLRN